MKFASTARKSLLAVAAALTLAGCVAEEPWTRERQERVTTATLPVGPDAALRAAERAVRELDPRSTKFDFSPSGFKATRQFSAYMVIAAMQGTYLYDVQVRPATEGSVINVKIYAYSTAITAAGVSPASGNMWQVDDAYQLLLDRTRYHAGVLNDWVSCEEARARYGTNGAIEPICLGAVARDPQK